MKRVAIVTSHFPPSNLAGVHRSRLWAEHLPEFGWQPVIVTADWRYYEETLDWDLNTLVAPGIEIVRTIALPTRPIRILGDVGLRALPWFYMAVAKLARDRSVDFIIITIPSNYCALLGPLIYARFGLPYGIDYQDPWVLASEEALGEGFRARASQWLARCLEPFAVRRARLITGINARYISGVLTRNPEMAKSALVVTMPIGAPSRDFSLVREQGRSTFLFDPDDGFYHIIYAGAMLPRAYGVLERFLEALVAFQKRDAARASRLRVHFVGTGTSPDDTEGFNVMSSVVRLGLGHLVNEHPHRISYVDVLNHLMRSDCVLVLGSAEAHYSPSKIFQAVQSRQPVLALLHEESSAVQILEEAQAGIVIKFSEAELPVVDEIVAALNDLLEGRGLIGKDVRWEAFSTYSARESARLLAGGLDRAVAVD